ncbi:hypothetical protein [Pseudoalteromonas undina]|uniref:hypothetical protein n=1 Tax=Pseudoalteromonas undina TaxID=43660 RepID=UPI001868BD7E|nr:hypothetical protein [Pseudoalteromonas undina]
MCIGRAANFKSMYEDTLMDNDVAEVVRQLSLITKPCLPIRPARRARNHQCNAQCAMNRESSIIVSLKTASLITIGDCDLAILVNNKNASAMSDNDWWSLDIMAQEKQ